MGNNMLGAAEGILGLAIVGGIAQKMLQPPAPPAQQKRRAPVQTQRRAPLQTQSRAPVQRTQTRRTPAQRSPVKKQSPTPFMSSVYIGFPKRINQ